MQHHKPESQSIHHPGALAFFSGRVLRSTLVGLLALMLLFSFVVDQARMQYPSPQKIQARTASWGNEPDRPTEPPAFSVNPAFPHVEEHFS